MPTGLPSLTPTAAELQAELANAALIVAAAPAGNYKTAVRPPGISNLNWWSNLAYYLSYPAAPAKIKAGDKPSSDAWLRCNAEVNRLMLAKVPTSPAWTAKKLTWPLLRKPAQWGVGGSYAARRPWKKDQPQTRQHTGIDLAAAPGTPILAPEGGTVVAPESGWEMVKDKATGQYRGVKCLLLATDSGLTVLLGGMRPGSALVQAGQRVEAGQQLAEVGIYPLGDSMLHISGYDKVLTEAQVNARKEWKFGSPPPQNLIDLSEYLKTAATNPKLQPQQGLFGDAGGGELVPNGVEDGEVDEGTPAGDPEDEDQVTPSSGGDGGGGGALAAAGGLFALLLGAGAWAASRKKKRRAA